VSSCIRTCHVQVEQLTAAAWAAVLAAESQRPCSRPPFSLASPPADHQLPWLDGSPQSSATTTQMRASPSRTPASLPPLNYRNKESPSSKSANSSTHSQRQHRFWQSQKQHAAHSALHVADVLHYSANRGQGVSGKSLILELFARLQPALECVSYEPELILFSWVHPRLSSSKTSHCFASWSCSGSGLSKIKKYVCLDLRYIKV